MPNEVKLPPELEAELASLVNLNDDALWQAGLTTVPVDVYERLADLNDKKQREGLTADEQGEADKLIMECERVMLVRAYAAATLKKRGYDVNGLLWHRPKD